MKRESALGGGTRRRPSVDAEAVALQAFGRVAAEPDRLERFLALSGLGPDTIRGAAGEPGFLAAILDHVASDESLLVAIAGEIGLDPSAVMEARERLSPSAVFDP